MAGIPTPHNARILIADSCPDEGPMFADYFSWLGFTIALCTSGAEAIRQSAESLPDAVLVNYVLEGCDGVDVCKALHQNASTAEIPTFILTTQTTAAALARARQSGAAEVVMVPCDLEALGTKVSAAIGQGRRGRDETRTLKRSARYRTDDLHPLAPPGVKTSLTP